MERAERPAGNARAFRLEATGPVLRRAIFRSVATTLAAAPVGSAILWEGDAAGQDLRLAASDPGLARTIWGSLAPIARGAFRWMDGLARSAALGPASGRWGVVEACPAPFERAPPSLADLPSPLAGFPRVVLQSHWLARPAGRVESYWRYVAPDDGHGSAGPDAVGIALVRFFETSLGIGAATRAVRPSRRRRRAFDEGTLRAFRARAPFRLSPAALEATAALWATPEAGAPEEGHRVLLGATGAGKTSFLVEEGVRAAARGATLLVFDLHGDLAPLLVARMRPADRDRLVALDATGPATPGVNALGSGRPEHREREAAQLVAALKRLSSEGGETYWGFRLERIFDTLVRLVQEEEGDLLDLWALLTEGRRREAARLATRSVEGARFLEEIGPILARNPEFLWPAAARLSKIALVPALARLLAPRDAGLPLDPLLAEGRPLVVRLPIGALGPEASGFAATLLAGQIFLRAVGRDPPNGAPRRVVFLLDEAHLFAPRLVAEMLTDGRKFGVAAWLATQYPDRLSPDVRAAAAGSVDRPEVFRTPPASAADAGEWVGLDPERSRAWLPELPAGARLSAAPDRAVRIERSALDPLPPEALDAWTRAVERTIAEFGGSTESVPRRTDEPPVESVLLALFGAARDDRSVTPEALRAFLQRAGSDPIDPETVDLTLSLFARRGWVARVGADWTITPAGLRYLGADARTGAVRESTEHRALLLAAFRLFAQQGAALEFVRQGRFPLARLPDARLRLLRLDDPSGAPHRLAERVDRLRGTWAWRFFGGRDVHVEAEVSGATRAERVRRGLEKARAAEAYALFLVSTPARARRIRAVLAAEGVAREEAGVWTIDLGRRFHGREEKAAPRLAD